VFPFKFIFEEKERKYFGHLTEWFEGIAKQGPFIQAFGQVRFCQKQFPVPEVKVEEKKEAPKKQEVAKPKEEKKPKKKDDDDGEEEDAEKKSKNALDDLPKSTFDLFSFKTLYVTPLISLKP